MYFRTYEIDRGAKAIQGLLLQLDGAHTDVGLPEGGRTSGRYSMDELVHIAKLNEFDIPEGQGRPFLRNSTDENSDKILTESAIAVDKVLARTAGVRDAIGNVGERQVFRIKQKIQEGPFAPLKASTVAKKGHDIPLFETGQLFESIQRKDTVRGSGSFAAAAVETVGA